MKVQIGTKKEQKRMPWERSEALYHMHETGSRKKEGKPFVTGLHEAGEGKTAAGRMRETFRAENSYGNIALGVNKKKEAVLVMSEKREHNGPVTAEAKKHLHMGRRRREIAPYGSFYTNPDLKQKGAAAFQAKLSLPSKRVLEQITRYDAGTGSQMMRKRMPYLKLHQERRKLKALEECRRKSSERRERAQAEWYNIQIQRLQNKIGRQEQAEKQMMKKLRDEWQKAQKAFAGSLDAQRSAVWEEQMEFNAAQDEEQAETNTAQEEEQKKSSEK